MIAGQGEGRQLDRPHASSMVPAVLRNDPGLVARPPLKHLMELWWAGALWDPRDANCSNFRDDFTCADSVRSILKAIHVNQQEAQSLLSALAAEDVGMVREHVTSGCAANMTLHAALQKSADPRLVRHICAHCTDLDTGAPEPTIVTWLRCVCEGHATIRGQRAVQGSVARLDALLEAGASINAPGKLGETPLHIVARHLRGVIILTTTRAPSNQFMHYLWHNLVQRGADSSLRDVQGVTPIELLTRDQYRELLSSKRAQYGMQKYKTITLKTKMTPRPQSDDMLSLQETSSWMTPRSETDDMFLQEQSWSHMSSGTPSTRVTPRSYSSRGSHCRGLSSGPLSCASISGFSASDSRAHGSGIALAATSGASTICSPSTYHRTPL